MMASSTFGLFMLAFVSIGSPETINVEFSDFTIPAVKDHSMYYCRITKIPAQPKSLNLIQTSVKIAEESKKLLLDAFMSRCIGDLESLVDRQFPCTDELTGDLAIVADNCYGKDFEFYHYNIGMPDKVAIAKNGGIPFVEPNVVQYILTSSEYVNNGPSDVVDHSSFQLELVEADPEKMADGFLYLGPLPGSDYFIVPPKQNQFTVSTMCTPNCLKTFPKDGIDIYSGSFFTYPTDSQLVNYTQTKTDPDSKCPSDFEEYSWCGSACEPTCRHEATVCTTQCVQGCFCKQGYIRSGLSAGNGIGKCIPETMCSDDTIQVRLRLIRDGIEMQPIFDEKFHPLAQGYMKLDSPRKVLPTDVLIAECVYNTEDRDKPRFGGFDVTNQWCNVELLYYPYTFGNTLTCRTGPKPESIYAKTMGMEVVGSYDPFHGGAVMVKNPSDSDDKAKKLSEVAETFNWTPEAVAALLDNQKTGDYFEYCFHPTMDEHNIRQTVTEKFSDVKYPEIKTKLNARRRR